MPGCRQRRFFSGGESVRRGPADPRGPVSNGNTSLLLNAMDIAGCEIALVPTESPAGEHLWMGTEVPRNSRNRLLEKDRRALARGVFTIRDAFATLPPWRADNASTEPSVGVRPSPVPQKSRRKAARILGSPPASLPGDASVGTRAASFDGTLHARDPPLAPGSQGSTGTAARRSPGLGLAREALGRAGQGLWTLGAGFFGSRGESRCVGRIRGWHQGRILNRVRPWIFCRLSGAPDQRTWTWRI